jgi:trehalose-phosphatase
MEVLDENLNIDAYFDLLKATDHRLLMLDYDGTLAPFVTDRDQAVPYPGVRRLLDEIVNQSPTRVVIISGRSVSVLMRLLATENPPELWGSHGFERRLPNGQVVTSELSDRSRAVLDDVATWAEDNVPASGREPKPAGYAFHWRGLDNEAASDLRRKVEDRWRETLSNHGLELHEFDGGLEVRVADINKGKAVRALMAECPSGCVMAYLGDDQTDEDAFAALQDADQHTLSVLVRAELRPTLADLWLRPPQELLSFVARWL